MWLVLLALACSGSTPAPTPTPALSASAPAPAPQPAASPAPGADFDACMDTCRHDNMARAVSAEMIEADCTKHCAPQAVVRTGSDLALRLGQRVTVMGTFQRTLHHGHGPEPYMGTAIVLSDGTPVWVATGDAPPDGWAPFLDKPVRAEGTLAQGPDGDPGTWLEKPSKPAAP